MGDTDKAALGKWGGREALDKEGREGSCANKGERQEGPDEGR